MSSHDLLLAILDAWRKTKSPSFGTLLRRLDETLVEPNPALPAPEGRAIKKRATKTDAIEWIDRFSNVAFAGLFASLREPLRLRGSYQLIEKLGDKFVEADPRVAYFALTLLGNRDLLELHGPKFWRRLCLLVEHHGDQLVGTMFRVCVAGPEVKDLWGEDALARFRSIDAKLATLPGDPEGLTDQIRELSARIEGTEPSAISYLQELLVKYFPKVARRNEVARTEDDLLAAVYSAPEDDAPREVYADFLMERGDPHGEFILLQLRAERAGLSVAERQREKEILRKHKAEWLGPRLRAATGVEFKRGFLWELTYSGSAAQAWKDPRWSTVNTIRGSKAFPQRAEAATRLIIEGNIWFRPGLRDRTYPNVRFVDLVDFDGAVSRKDIDLLRNVCPRLERLRLDGAGFSKLLAGDKVVTEREANPEGLEVYVRNLLVRDLQTAVRSVPTFAKKLVIEGISSNFGAIPSWLEMTSELLRVGLSDSPIADDILAELTKVAEQAQAAPGGRYVLSKLTNYVGDELAVFRALGEFRGQVRIHQKRPHPLLERFLRERKDTFPSVEWCAWEEPPCL